MKLRNNTNDRLEFPAVVDEYGQTVVVDPGESFEVTGEQAKSLLDQNENFKRVDTPARQKAAAARRNDDKAAPAAAEES